MKNGRHVAYIFMTILLLLCVAVFSWQVRKDRYWIDQGGKNPPMTRLMLAAANGDFSEAKHQLGHARDINEKTLLGHSALFYALYNHNCDIATFLLQNGADPNLSHESIATMILSALSCGDETVLSLILDQLTDQNFGILDTLHLLIADCRTGDIEILIELQPAREPWLLDIVREYPDFYSLPCYAELVTLLNKYE